MSKIIVRCSVILTQIRYSLIAIAAISAKKLDLRANIRPVDGHSAEVLASGFRFPVRVNQWALLLC